MLLVVKEERTQRRKDGGVDLKFELWGTSGNSRESESESDVTVQGVVQQCMFYLFIIILIGFAIWCN